jgi:hypothetical protein
LIQFSLRCVYIESILIAQALAKNRDKIPDEASNELVRILNDATKYKRTSTSTSRKSLSRDTDNFVELYMLSVSQIQATKKQEILVEKTVHTYFSDCTMEEVDNNSDKT